MNGAESKGGPRVPKPLESDAPRPRPAKPVAAEKRVLPLHVDFSGGDAALLKALAAVQAQLAELRTVRVGSRALASTCTDRVQHAGGDLYP